MNGKKRKVPKVMIKFQMYLEYSLLGIFNVTFQGPVSQSSSQAQLRRVSAELETCLNGDGDEDGFLGGA